MTSAAHHHSQDEYRAASLATSTRIEAHAVSLSVAGARWNHCQAEGIQYP